MRFTFHRKSGDIVETVKLRKHQFDRSASHDLHRIKIMVKRSHRNLAEIVYQHMRTLNRAHVLRKCLSDGIPGDPLPDTYPEFFKYDACQILRFNRGCRAEQMQQVLYLSAADPRPLLDLKPEERSHPAKRVEPISRLKLGA